MLHINAPPQAVAEMERNMRIDEDILRYLTIRSDAFEDGPSVMMQTRSPREDRHVRDTKGKAAQPEEKAAQPEEKANAAKETPVESAGETSSSAPVETSEETTQ